MTPEATIQAAALLERLRLTPGFRLERLPRGCRPESEAEGYAVNDALHRRLAAAGFGDHVGYKLGCTTPLMQERIGLDHPAVGRILESTVFQGELALDWEAARNLGCETEITVRLGKDLPAGDAPWDAERVLPYVDTVMGSIELVEQRYVLQEETRRAHIPTVIADDFWHWGSILAPPVANWRDLDLGTNRAETFLDGASQGSGEGSAALGHPLQAVAWLANHLAARGRELKAGMIVQTGSLVSPVRPAAGQTVVADHGALGRVAYRAL